MAQYLLSVFMIDGQEPPAPEVIEVMHRQVGEFNESLQASGAWVFAGGLFPADTASVVRTDTGKRGSDRRPVHRSQGAHRWLLDRRSAGP